MPTLFQCFVLRFTPYVCLQCICSYVYTHFVILSPSFLPIISIHNLHIHSFLCISSIHNLQVWYFLCISSICNLQNLYHVTGRICSIKQQPRIPFICVFHCPSLECISLMVVVVFKELDSRDFSLNQDSSCYCTYKHLYSTYFFLYLLISTSHRFVLKSAHFPHFYRFSLLSSLFHFSHTFGAPGFLFNPLPITLPHLIPQTPPTPLKSPLAPIFTIKSHPSFCPITFFKQIGR